MEHYHDISIRFKALVYRERVQAALFTFFAWLNRSSKFKLFHRGHLTSCALVTYAYTLLFTSPLMRYWPRHLSLSKLSLRIISSIYSRQLKDYHRNIINFVDVTHTHTHRCDAILTYIGTKKSFKKFSFCTTTLTDQHFHNTRYVHSSITTRVRYISIYFLSL